MTDASVRIRESAGQVTFRKATLNSLEVRPDYRLVAHLQRSDGKSIRETFDAVVNCTGFDNAKALKHNSLLGRLHDRGMIAPHPTGLGIIADAESRIVTANGNSTPKIRVVGPLTVGVFGDPLGVFFISAQIHRLIPGLAEQLELKLFN